MERDRVEACAESAFELIRIHEGFLLKFKDGRSSRTAWARVTTGSSAAPRHQPAGSVLRRERRVTTNNVGDFEDGLPLRLKRAGTARPLVRSLGRMGAYGVGSATDQAKMSVFPKVAGHSAGSPVDPPGTSTDQPACPARQDWTGPQTSPSRTSFQTATAYSFVAAA